MRSTHQRQRQLAALCSLTQNTLVKVVNDAGKLSFEPANESREADANELAPCASW